MMVVQSKCGLYRAVITELPSGCCEVEYQRRFGQDADWQRQRVVETKLSFHVTRDLAHVMINGE